MKSMTGFGRASTNQANVQVDIEIKSVNHRFLEVVSRIPKELNFMELALKKHVSAQLKRGRIEFFLNLKKSADSQKKLVINWSLVDEAVAFSTEASLKYDKIPGLDFKSGLMELIASSDFLTVEDKELAEEIIEPLVIEATEKALMELVASRLSEGLHLKEHLLNHLEQFQLAIDQIKGFSELFEEQYRTRLEGRLQEVVGNFIDEPRLLTELAMLLEKADIHEELERLDSHIIHFQQLVEKQEPVGRELDFLIQEMNREVNTIGSKANQLKLSNTVILMKTQLEKIREQVQNIE